MSALRDFLDAVDAAGLADVSRAASSGWFSVPATHRSAVRDCALACGLEVGQVSRYTAEVRADGDRALDLLCHERPLRHVSVAYATVLLDWDARLTDRQPLASIIPSARPGVSASHVVDLPTGDADQVQVVRVALTTEVEHLMTDGPYGSDLQPGDSIAETLATLIGDLLPGETLRTGLSIDNATPLVLRNLDLLASARALAPTRGSAARSIPTRPDRPRTAGRS